MSEDETAPAMPTGVVTDRPNVARVYDWYLGGASNFEVDRELGGHVIEQFPLIVPMIRSNRRWMGRVVRDACRAGLRQFLDLGSGVPTVGNVHEIVAHEVGDDEPAAVVYVDNEHVAVEHSRLTLREHGAESWVGVAQEDYRDPQAVLNHPETRRLLDFTQPVCVVMSSVLHLIGPGDNPAAVVEAYRAPLAASSWLAISHPSAEDADPDTAEQIHAAVGSYRASGTPAWLRDHDEISPWLDGLRLLEPGLVHGVDWRPDTPAGHEPPEAEARSCYWTVVGEVSR